VNVHRRHELSVSLQPSLRGHQHRADAVTVNFYDAAKQLGFRNQLLVFRRRMISGGNHQQFTTPSGAGEIGIVVHLGRRLDVTGHVVG